MEVPRLSCEQCRRRKTKCDKESPCSACVKAGMVCHAVSRRRKSRGNTKRVEPKGNSLDARVAHLEDLVVQLRAHAKKSQHTENGHEGGEGTEGHSQPPSNKIGSFIAPSFWEALSNEVLGIRDILEDGEEERESSANQENSPRSGSVIEQNESQSEITAKTIIFNHVDSQHSYAYLQQDLTADMSFALLRVYQQRVDCICKVVDWPAVAEIVRRNHNHDPAEMPTTLSEKALEASIYFTALCTLSDKECESMLSCPREALLKKFRVSAESAISRAGLLVRPDLTALQSFVIYLVGLRSSSQCASSWNLIAIAIRIAISMGLGSDGKGYSSYDIQIRRRVWYSLGVLDLQFALDRGSPSILSISDFQNPPPLCIDDSDLRTAIHSSKCFCQMSFASMTHQAMLCQKRVCTESAENLDLGSSWNQKIEAINDFERLLMRLFGTINEHSSPIERFAKATAFGSALNIKIMLRRPPYPNGPNPVPPDDDFDIMEATTRALEISLQVKEYPTFSWNLWVKWYVLAVLLAELCTSREGRDMEHSLSVAQQSFKQLSHQVSDSESGMLWKPIAKLMHRVQMLRNNSYGVTANKLPADDATGGDLGLGALRIPDQSLEPWIVPPQPLGLEWNYDFDNTGLLGSNGFGLGWVNAAGPSATFTDEMSWTHWDNFLQDINMQQNGF